MKRLSILWFCLSFLTLGLFVAGCGDSPERDLAPGGIESASKKSGTPGKVLMVIAPQNFRDEELLVPRKALEEAGFTVEIASTERTTCTGMLGAKAEPDLILKSVKPADYQAVVFVGGSGASVLFDDREAHRIAKEAYKNNCVVGAICIAPVILAEAGLLEGKEVSVWRSMGDVCEKKGAEVTGDEVTCDGRIITGNGPKAAEAFGKALVKALK
ncbi:MAG: DJ-1/PfpI family protein [Planctomycetes bacterium]|nr:DJ-1/PfpI family protein [Planctomycetota bacterium]